MDPTPDVQSSEDSGLKSVHIKCNGPNVLEHGWRHCIEPSPVTKVLLRMISSSQYRLVLYVSRHDTL